MGNCASGSAAGDVVADQQQDRAPVEPIQNRQSVALDGERRQTLTCWEYDVPAVDAADPTKSVYLGQESGVWNGDEETDPQAGVQPQDLNAEKQSSRSVDTGTSNEQANPVQETGLIRNDTPGDQADALEKQVQPDLLQDKEPQPAVGNSSNGQTHVDSEEDIAMQQPPTAMTFDCGEEQVDTNGGEAREDVESGLQVQPNGATSPDEVPDNSVLGEPDQLIASSVTRKSNQLTVNGVTGETDQVFVNGITGEPDQLTANGITGESDQVFVNSVTGEPDQLIVDSATGDLDQLTDNGVTQESDQLIVNGVTGEPDQVLISDRFSNDEPLTLQETAMAAPITDLVDSKIESKEMMTNKNDETVDSLKEDTAKTDDDRTGYLRGVQTTTEVDPSSAVSTHDDTLSSTVIGDHSNTIVRLVEISPKMIKSSDMKKTARAEASTMMNLQETEHDIDPVDEARQVKAGAASNDADMEDATGNLKRNNEAEELRDSVDHAVVNTTSGEAVETPDEPTDLQLE